MCVYVRVRVKSVVSKFLYRVIRNVCLLRGPSVRRKLSINILCTSSEDDVSDICRTVQFKLTYLLLPFARFILRPRFNSTPSDKVKCFLAKQTGQPYALASLLLFFYALNLSCHDLCHRSIRLVFLLAA